MLVFAVVPFLHSLWALWTALVLGGICWACININSYPFIVSTGREQSIGTRTGTVLFGFIAGGYYVTAISRLVDRFDRSSDYFVLLRFRHDGARTTMRMASKRCGGCHKNKSKHKLRLALVARWVRGRLVCQNLI